MSAICGLVANDFDLVRLRQALKEMVETLPLYSEIGWQHIVDHPGGGFGVYQQFSQPDTDRLRSVCRQHDLCVVCAGDFYNAPELKAQFNGTGSRLEQEASLIATMYRQRGPRFLSLLRGAFSLAVWDGRRRQLLLATDPFGIRPLHYCFDNARLAFGSRISAVLKAPEIPKRIDLNAIYEYFFFSCIPTPDTAYLGIKKVPPGHYLLFSQASLKIEPYWKIRFEEDFSQSPSYFADGIRTRLKEAVRTQSNYQEPARVGAFLSGGTDSSTISGLLGSVLGRTSKTFSIGFGEDQFNEISYARIANHHFQTEHREYFVTPEDTAALIPDLVQAYDEPFGNASAVPTYYCARLARQNGVELMLAGDGGDELFGGNSRYADDKIFEVYQQVPQWFRKYCFEPLLFGLPMPGNGLFGKARKYVRRSNIPQPQRYFSYNLLYTVDPKEIFSKDFLATIDRDSPLSLAREYYEGAGVTSMLNRLLHIDLKIIITDNDLRKVTRMCELANVRVRYPMLDLDLVEFTGTIPAPLKVKGFDKRHIFKEAFRGFLPPEIIAKKKHGFGLPISPWLRKTSRLRELAQDTLLSQASLQRGYFKPGFLEHLFELHRNDQSNFFGDNLWVFLMLELWHQSNRE
ncbi:MAG: asparagine synthase (glutamine-hydrolyzing) [Acidobacteria bacterium]|nr:asparagine synthase (glutamine-hydrolyzing) [Acidobacteriota bacterium]MCI0721073.1 asparagine synthase (glutamine-hydrolyzing) [Acidobacteriota bacterium]